MRSPGVRVGGDNRRAERVSQQVKGVGVRVRAGSVPRRGPLMPGGRVGGADSPHPVMRTGRRAAAGVRPAPGAVLRRPTAG
jgi:hypothetical protein